MAKQFWLRDNKKEFDITADIGELHYIAFPIETKIEKATYHVIEKSAYNKAVEALKSLAEPVECSGVGCSMFSCDCEGGSYLAKKTLEELGEL